MSACSLPLLTNLCDRPIYVGALCCCSLISVGRYEGNISYGWGALTGYTESRRAWTAMVNQVAMAGHSNTNLPGADTESCAANPGKTSCNAVMWWNKGHRLYGESPARLDWYKQYLAGELGVAVPSFDDTISTNLAGCMHCTCGT